MLWWIIILKFEGDRTELRRNFVCSENPGKKIWNKTDKSSKIEQDKKSLISTFACFWLSLPKCNLLKGHRVLGYVSNQIRYFNVLSFFPKIRSLTSLGNSWGNSYTKLAVLDATFRFTCGWVDLRYDILMFQYIMNKIAWKFSFHPLHFQWWFNFLQNQPIWFKKVSFDGECFLEAAFDLN